MESSDSKKPKSPHAEREERILSFWDKEGVFDKSLAKGAPKGEFVFYEGPPTANGRPGIHHLEARAFKDAIPRYKAMQGYHVRRKGGWDTHGLPVEIQVQKELGLKSKKDIEAYGIEKFNEKCKESVWTYVHEWEDFTERMGYWVDLKNPYITYKPDYMESLWNILKTADDKKLLYKDYRVVPWCPHDETVLSSHELAQGYETVKDLTVTAKFKLKNGQQIVYMPSDGKQAILDTTSNKIYFLAWTTTPWTLPGNAGLAVNAYENYVIVEVGEEKYILAEKRIGILSNLVYKRLGYIGEGNLLDQRSIKYEPLYQFLEDNVSGAEKDKLANSFKVYAADFVTTSEGTGIVHIAPMYGQDDFELGTKVGLPKYHLVNEDGTFKKETGFLAGKFVKDENVAVEIIKDLANRPSGSLLFAKEKHEHTYPFCWRCHTPLIYFARDSWYIGMSKLRDTLVKENQGIHWEPDYIKEGRFGEWLREVKDWAISRERYWGTPLPVWVCETCKKRKVAGSVADVSKKPKNTYYVMRHGEAENNVKGILSGHADVPHSLTQKGKDQVQEAAARIAKAGIDLIIASDFIRTKESADLVAETLKMPKASIVYDARIREVYTGEFDQKPIEQYHAFLDGADDSFHNAPVGGESYSQVKQRAGQFLYDVEQRYSGKTILMLSHETTIWGLNAAAQGWDAGHTMSVRDDADFISNGEVRKLDFALLPHNAEYELDLHRPYIDEVVLTCSCGGDMKRVKEVMDVWFDSGAMPFAQDHYPFESVGKNILGIAKKQQLPYPADFISEAIDQTRGWFYTLHAIGAIMGKGKAYKNVISLGHILDAEGKKMSKSIGNVVNPWDMMDKYGADALRFWMYSVNQPGESKNFDEKTVDEIIKKVFNLVTNVTAFYKMYEDKAQARKAQGASKESQNILDRWIITRLDQLVENVTRNMDAYILLEPTRAIRDFIADLSQWYLRRSRDRFKEEGADKSAALATTKHVLLTLAKVMAPFTPFFAEELYLNVGGPLESVHLEDWPMAGKVDERLLKDMEMARTLSSKGLEARMKAKMNVRQVLNSLSSGIVLDPDFIEVLIAEVNVKNYVLDESLKGEVRLDTVLTPELKEEGMLRELVRAIQDLRKEKNLTVNDKATLLVDTDDKGKAFIEKNKMELMKATLLKDVQFKTLTTEEVVVGESKFKLDI